MDSGDPATLLVKEAEARGISLKDLVKEKEVRWVWFCTPLGGIGKAYPESEQNLMWCSAEDLTDVVYFIATESEVL